MKGFSSIQKASSNANMHLSGGAIKKHVQATIILENS